MTIEQGVALKSIERVMLMAPTTRWGFGRATYQKDFDRMDQWWLAYRGEFWGPARPGASRRPESS